MQFVTKGRCGRLFEFDKGGSKVCARKKILVKKILLHYICQNLAIKNVYI